MAEIEQAGERDFLGDGRTGMRQSDFSPYYCR